jgi:pyruvate formate lyase activating enzyme
MNSGVEYEFRTTVLPALHNEESFKKMGEMIRGANKYFIQNFRAENTLNPDYEKERSFTTSELNRFKKIMERYVQKVAIRENV